MGETISPTIIGQSEGRRALVSNLAALPEVRRPQIEAKASQQTAEKNIEFVNLNPIDIRLSSYPDELFDALAANMAEKGISSEQIPTAL